MAFLCFNEGNPLLTVMRSLSLKGNQDIYNKTIENLLRNLEKEEVPGYFLVKEKTSKKIILYLSADLSQYLKEHFDGWLTR